MRTGLTAGGGMLLGLIVGIFFGTPPLGMVFGLLLGTAVAARRQRSSAPPSH